MGPITNWMAFEGGVDLCAMTKDGLAAPNVIVHVARIVHTPVGSAAAGMLFWHPDPAGKPLVAGFVAGDPKVGAYFGPSIFTGTAFEHAPALRGKIDVRIDLPDQVSSRVETVGHVFEVRLAGLGDMTMIHRAPAATTPFLQTGVEAAALRASLTVDGREIPIVLPPAGISGGAPAVYAPAGIYAR
jgi:hypothetical protein